MLSKVLLAAATIGVATACPDHTAPLEQQNLRKRAEGQDWAYEASFDWGQINPEYELCQIGSMQAPIPLLLTQGLSLGHQPAFNFPEGGVNGTWINWGYGPGFTPYRDPNMGWDTMPSVTFEENMPDLSSPGSNTSRNETVYFAGFHIHSPADHSVGGDRSKAELRLVFANATGHNRAVFGMRIDPGNTDSPFFSSLPPMISFRDATRQEPNVNVEIGQALVEANMFNEFWTYRGSLTSPPCTEGLRWYVARNIVFVGNRQMQDILRVSTYSARAEQEVWQHAVNV